MHARWWRVKLCAVGMRNAILGNDLKDAFSWSKSDFIVNTERKNARELASFKLSVLSSAKTIELYRFSRRLSCNPSPALIIFSEFSPLNRFGGESYLVISRNLKREIWSHYEIKNVLTHYYTLSSNDKGRQTELLYLRTQIRYWRRTCHVYGGSKVINSLGRTKLTNASGKEQLELSTSTWSGCAPWKRGKFAHQLAGC